MVQRTTKQGSAPIGQSSAERAALSYFVVMVRYPAQRASEAVVNPEHTRGKVIDLIARGEWENIEFIHHVSDGHAVDVTDELLEAAKELEAA